MPVPVPTPETQEPRRLLRDVVYDKMFYAILDGTLELGERLNDEELVRWLGVSRTPVREAIAKLAEQGLVDIEANRYTRVVAPTYAEFLDIVRAGYEVWGLIMHRGIPLLSEADRTFLVDTLENRATGFATGEKEDLASFESISTRALAAAQSPSLERLRLTTGPLATLLFRRAGSVAALPDAQSKALADALRAAVAAGDAAAARDAITSQPDDLGEFFAEVKASGLFR